MTPQEKTFAAQEWERQLNELQAQASKRFWSLVPVGNGNQFEVHDQLGRVLYGPNSFMGLRGFFKNLPLQA